MAVQTGITAWRSSPLVPSAAQPWVISLHATRPRHLSRQLGGLGAQRRLLSVVRPHNGAPGRGSGSQLGADSSQVVAQGLDAPGVLKGQPHPAGSSSISPVLAGLRPAGNDDPNRLHRDDLSWLRFATLSEGAQLVRSSADGGRAGPIRRGRPAPIADYFPLAKSVEVGRQASDISNSGRGPTAGTVNGAEVGQNIGPALASRLAPVVAIGPFCGGRKRASALGR